MKTLSFLTLLALALAVSACGTGTNNNVINTTTSGNWEAQLIGGTGGASQLNFVTAFTVTNSGPLDITGFNFINVGSCFGTGVNATDEAGTATLTTSSTGQVTGSMSFTITSTTTGNVLTLTATAPSGGVSGTSNGTVTSTGTLTNGVAWGTWQLSPGQGANSCTASGSFLMCEGATTCTIP